MQPLLYCRHYAIYMILLAMTVAANIGNQSSDNIRIHHASPSLLKCDTVLEECAPIEMISMTDDTYFMGVFYGVANEYYESEKNIVPDEAMKTNETVNTEPASGNNPDIFSTDAGSACLYDLPLSADQQNYAKTVADEYGLDVRMIYGVMSAESNYTVDITSEDGQNYGIMQINSINSEWLRDTLGVSDLLDYCQNVRSGAYILSVLTEKYCDINSVLMCYRYGETGVRRQWDKGITSDHYCETVIAEMERLDSGF